MAALNMNALTGSSCSTSKAFSHLASCQEMPCRGQVFMLPSMSSEVKCLRISPVTFTFDKIPFDSPCHSLDNKRTWAASAPILSNLMFDFVSVSLAQSHSYWRKDRMSVMPLKVVWLESINLPLTCTDHFKAPWFLTIIPFFYLSLSKKLFGFAQLRNKFRSDLEIPQRRLRHWPMPFWRWKRLKFGGYLFGMSMPQKSQQLEEW